MCFLKGLKRTFVSKKFTLLAALVLSSALILAIPRAEAAQYNMRLHTNQPASQNAYQYFFGKKFAGYAAEYTSGKVQVNIFPGSQLGRDPEVFQQIQLGAVQLGIFAFPNIVEFYPPLNIFNMPYLFESFEGAANAFRGPVAEKIYKSFEERSGVRTLGVFNGGFRGITNSVREIKTVADLKGLKIRVPGSPILIDTMKAIGINPVNISAGDLFSALQLGTVDGQESGVSWSFGQGYAEIQKHLTLTEHAVSGTGLFVNAAYFEKLPKDIQDALKRAAVKALEDTNAYCQKLDEDTISKYKAAGLTVTKLKVVDVQPLIKPVWDKYAPKVGGIELIEGLVADGRLKN